jgi:hypothetical protein
MNACNGQLQARITGCTKVPVNGSCRHTTAPKLRISKGQVNRGTEERQMADVIGIESATTPSSCSDNVSNQKGKQHADLGPS